MVLKWHRYEVEEWTGPHQTTGRGSHSLIFYCVGTATRKLAKQTEWFCLVSLISTLDFHFKESFPAKEHSKPNSTSSSLNWYNAFYYSRFRSSHYPTYVNTALFGLLLFHLYNTVRKKGGRCKQESNILPNPSFPPRLTRYAKRNWEKRGFTEHVRHRCCHRILTP